jgi:hypothetical protein
MQESALLVAYDSTKSDRQQLLTVEDWVNSEAFATVLATVTYPAPAGSSIRYSNVENIWRHINPFEGDNYL